MATLPASQVQPSDAELKATNGDISIQLRLGVATLSLGASGRWELDHATLHQAEERARVSEEHNAALELENAALRDECTRMKEESNMEKFKCQLLVEMLAVSTLDEERSRTQAKQEEAHVASLKSDIAVLLEHARLNGIDMCKLSDLLAAKR
ncbi:hypothetical protein CCR75_006754 [Bremia lactucae]|uniref:Uncharacterized protein n=1 Tax=Bremia lactucae TaxID=4779 RepID=A0A976IBF8_BRELC|nr:hypothetical protein CCR75_006754 [Bremia lactucae]